MNSQKRVSQVSLLISTIYFQNIIIMFCMELCYSVEKYNVRCRHSDLSIGNNIFRNGIMKLEKFRRFYFQIRNTKMAP
jgi:hypothetical protein